MQYHHVHFDKLKCKMVHFHFTLILLLSHLYSSFQYDCYLTYGEKIINLRMINDSNTCINNKIITQNYFQVDFQFIKVKAANSLYFSIAFNISIKNHNNKGYLIKIEAGNENISKLITNNYYSLENQQTHLSSQFLINKSNQEKILFLQISQLSNDFTAFYCTKVPLFNQIENPTQWTPNIFIEFTFWLDRIIFVSFNPAPNKFKISYYIIRLITNDYQIHKETFIYQNQLQTGSMNKINFHNLKFGAEYFVVIEAICIPLLKCCKKAESELFTLPLLQSESKGFNHIHTIILSSCACILLIIFLTALLLRERRRIQQNKKILLILPSNDDIYQTSSLVNLLQKCNLNLVIEEWRNMINSETDLLKIILNSKFVVILWSNCNEEKINDDIFENNNLEMDNALTAILHSNSNIPSKKFVNVFWDNGVCLNDIPLMFQSFISFSLPSEVQKFLCCLTNSKKCIDMKHVCEFYEVIKMNNDKIYSDNFNSDFIETDFESEFGASCYYDYNYFNDSDTLDSRKIFLPVFHENSGTSGNTNCSSVLLHCK